MSSGVEQSTMYPCHKFLDKIKKSQKNNADNADTEKELIDLFKCLVSKSNEQSLDRDLLALQSSMILNLHQM